MLNHSIIARVDIARTHVVAFKDHWRLLEIEPLFENTV
jgi:hypothetical protein